MSPDSDRVAPGFVLLCSDAAFSRAVMHELARSSFLPEFVVLPEYAPAARAEGESLLQTGPRRDLPAWFDSLELLYAPEQRQLDCARSIAARSPRFMLVACWPYLLHPEMISAVSDAALNLHPSLLPAYRGADPIGAQLDHGDFRFGITLHEINQDFDRGDIIAQRELPPLSEPPRRQQLERQCAAIGVEMFIQALLDYPAWRRQPQPLDTV